MILINIEFQKTAFVCRVAGTATAEKTMIYMFFENCNTTERTIVNHIIKSLTL